MNSALSIKGQEADRRPYWRFNTCSFGTPGNWGNAILHPGERELLIKKADIITKEDTMVLLAKHVRTFKEKKTTF